MATTLVEYTTEGAKIIDNPKLIKKQYIELTEEHMGKGRKKYFIHNHKLMPEMRKDSTWAKQVCKVKNKTKWNKLMENIPEKLRCVFKHAQPPRKLKTKRIRNNIHIRDNADKAR